MFKKDDVQIRREFKVRKVRQVRAIAVALFLVLLLAMLYRRPVFGELSKTALFGAQVMVISAFIGFSGFNWRCPSCNKFLDSDIARRNCRKCGAGLE
ncbi:MAG: hypothetical protein HZB33_11360 [Nitrospirae bacterium]|nr:hypothetical protein [Nitrospirota bacterium]